MKASLDSFITELDDLQHHIETFNLEARLLAVTEHSESLLLQYQKQVQKYNTKKRQFNYTSIIISLYSSLELFVRSLTKGYLNSLNEIVPHYIDLPETIRKNHLDLSCKQMERIKNLDELESITARNQIIFNLNSCISNEGSYHLNTEAFIQNTANFRSSVIIQLFESVGVKNVLTYLVNDLVFIDQLKTIDPDVDDWHKVSAENFQTLTFFRLDDLVERRNAVAHGNSDGILPLPNEILIEYIAYFRAYGYALYNIIYSATLPYLAKKAIKLGNPTRIFQDGHVFNIEVNKNIVLAIGDMIIAKPVEDKFLYLAGEIQDIQLNEGEKVGIKVPFKAKKNQTIYIIPRTV